VRHFTFGVFTAASRAAAAAGVEVAGVAAGVATARAGATTRGRWGHSGQRRRRERHNCGQAKPDPCHGESPQVWLSEL
jgi:hypothetical protein